MGMEKGWHVNQESILIKAQVSINTFGTNQFTHLRVYCKADKKID